MNTNPNRRTIVAHGRLAIRELRLDAARQRLHGLQILSFEQLAVRLAGGFTRLIDDESLRSAIQAALPETPLGELDGIKLLPGMVDAAADTLHKVWRSGIDLAARAHDHQRLASIARLEAAVQERLLPGMMRPADLVAAALKRLVHAPAAIGPVEIVGITELSPSWRPLLAALSEHVPVSWVAGPRPVPEWLAATGIKVHRSDARTPAYVYWTALAKWGLIGTRPDGRPWSRPDMAKLLASSSKQTIHDDDGKPFEAMAWPISGLIDAPADWEDWGNWNERYNEDGDGKLTLDLTPREQSYIAGKLRAVRSPNDPGEPSLLAKLVGKPLDGADHCWDAAIVSLAGHEAPMLKRAGQAAALSAIGRAIYAALVEILKENRDKRPQPDRHRSALKDTVDQWGKQASRLDMNLFLDEIGHLPPPVEAVLKDTFAWVRAGGKDPMSLLDVYAGAEVSRKDDRARLAANQFGVDRRMEWQGEHHGQADPLHYRWGNVKRLLRDLYGVA